MRNSAVVFLCASQTESSMFDTAITDELSVTNLKLHTCFQNVHFGAVCSLITQQHYNQN